MTPTDLRILCAALGFTTVVIQGKKFPKKESDKLAAAFANLIEEFCRVTIPSALGVANDDLNQNTDNVIIDEAIDRFKDDLITKQNARLPEDKATLCLFYSRLQARQTKKEQKQFFSKATEDVIANHILHMIDEELMEDI